MLETRYIVIEAESADPIVCMRRTDVEYADIAALTEDMMLVCGALDGLGRERRKLLVDLRQGPRRNDPRFEEAMAQLRPRLFRGFRGAAVLVRTAVGALQVKRHIREDGAGAEVFHDEQEAIEYLRGQSVRGDIPSSVLVSRRAARASATSTTTMTTTTTTATTTSTEAVVPSRTSRPTPLPQGVELDEPTSGSVPPTRPSRTSSF